MNMTLKITGAFHLIPEVLKKANLNLSKLKGRYRGLGAKGL